MASEYNRANQPSVIGERLPGRAPSLVAALENEGAERAMLLRVQDAVARQAAEAMRVAPLISKVDRDLF